MSQDDKISKIEQNPIQNYLRIKPYLNNNPNPFLPQPSYLKLSNDKTMLQISSQNYNQEFYFKKIFQEDTSLKDLFTIIGVPLCNSFLEGYNVSFIFYGKPQTGKTYTILGDKNNKGILFSAVEYIFNKLSFNFNNKNLEYSLSLSYFEVYDDVIFDFFDTNYYSEDCILNIEKLFSKEIENIQKLNILSLNDVIDLVNKGLEIKNFLYEELKINNINGHSIYKIYMEQIDNLTKVKIKNEITFIEIFSPKNNMINNMNDINNFLNKNIYNKLYTSSQKSISNFSYIINQLSDKVNNKAVSYNISYLTKFLKDILGGNSKTTIITHISSDINDSADSITTLNFSQRFQKIVNYPILNNILYLKNTNIKNFNKLIELQQKNQMMKMEKNYLTQFLEKQNIIEINNNNNLSQKKNNTKKKEKEIDQKEMSTKDNLTEIKKINPDIENNEKLKNIYLDERNRLKLNYIIKIKEIQKVNQKLLKISTEKDTMNKNINEFKIQNISLDKQTPDTEISKKTFLIQNEQEINKLNRQLISCKFNLETSDNTIINLQRRSETLIIENEQENNHRNVLEKIRNSLIEEKKEILQKINENSKNLENLNNSVNEINEKIETSKKNILDFEQKNKYLDELNTKTLNDFKNIYSNTINEINDTNNKHFEIKKNNWPNKENQFLKLKNDLNDLNNQNYNEIINQQQIIITTKNYEDKINNIKQQNKNYQSQINEIENKISILNFDLNNLNSNNNLNSLNEITLTPIKKNENSRSIFDSNSFLSNSPIFSSQKKNIFTSNLKSDMKDFTYIPKIETKREKLIDNKVFLFNQEKQKNKFLKQKKENLVKNLNHKIKQLKNNNSKNKIIDSNNFIKLQENIKKKENKMATYQNCIDENYNLLSNYFNNGEDPENYLKNVDFNKFNVMLGYFFEKAMNIDQNYEKIKQEFKDTESEYKFISKNGENLSLTNNPKLKNYKETIKGNNTIKKNDRKSANNNYNLFDKSNIHIYNSIYPQKRKKNQVLEQYTKNNKKKQSKKIINFFDNGSKNNKSNSNNSKIYQTIRLEGKKKNILNKEKKDNENSNSNANCKSFFQNLGNFNNNFSSMNEMNNNHLIYENRNLYNE